MAMTEREFVGRVRGLVETCLPSELRAFDLSGRNFVHELFQKGKIKQRTSAGDSEFADARGVKRLLEFVPLLDACYALSSRAGKANKTGRPARQSADELLLHLTAFGVRHHVASMIVSQFSDVLHSFEA